MVETMARWMNHWAPDNKAAEQWLQTSIGLYGSDVVKRGFGELRAKMAQGDVVGRPIPLFARICERIKADGLKKGKPVKISRFGLGGPRR
jgi:hypothetical protein